MSDAPPDTEELGGTGAADAAGSAERVLTPFGVAAAALGALAVVAAVLAGLIWTGHHRASADRAYEGRALLAAADWAGMLANIDTDNVEATLARLHDGTVGELNAEFEAAMRPYRDVVRRLKSHSTGQVDAVALESVHRDEADRARPPADPFPAELAGRTDTVLVVATSVADNSGGEPKTVRWLLRLGVSEVDGTPMISALEFLR